MVAIIAVLIGLLLAAVTLAALKAYDFAGEFDTSRRYARRLLRRIR